MKRLYRTKKTRGRRHRHSLRLLPQRSSFRGPDLRRLWKRRAWYAGYNAGRRALRHGGRLAPRTFERWLSTTGLSGPGRHRLLLDLSESFGRGYVRSSRGRFGAVPLTPLKSRVSAVVSAGNHAATLTGVLQELKRLPLHEIVVVIHGSEDDSYSIARSAAGVIVIHLPEQMGQDAVRGFGAKVSTGNVVLFLNGDFAVPASQLYAFLAAADRGVEVALNDITPLLPPFAEQNEQLRCQAFLNRMLKRDDLGANSLTVLPYALSRRAIETIGYENLAVPPKAQALAIQRGLRVESVHTVDVLSGRIGSDAAQEAAGQIIGDHIEAVTEVMKEQGSRLHWGQVSRQELALRRNGT